MLIHPILGDNGLFIQYSVYLSMRHRQIDRILDEQTTVTRNQIYQRYLVRWKDQPPTKDTWMSMEDLMQQDPDILERF